MNHILRGEKIHYQRCWLVIYFVLWLFHYLESQRHLWRAPQLRASSLAWWAADPLDFINIFRLHSYLSSVNWCSRHLKGLQSQSKNLFYFFLISSDGCRSLSSPRWAGDFTVIYPNFYPWKQFLQAPDSSDWNAAVLTFSSHSLVRKKKKKNSVPFETRVTFSSFNLLWGAHIFLCSLNIICRIL